MNTEKHIMSIDKMIKEILANPITADPEQVLETIEKAKESGNHLILEGLFDLLQISQSPEIKKSVVNLLSELKSKESVPYLIEAIKNEKYKNERVDLISCCWQNGLIYNTYLPFFIDLVIHEPFLIAFEAFTVIENMYGIVEEAIIEQEIIKITEALNSSGEEKAYLLNGLLTIIRDIPEVQEFTA